jgi:hypothetical protein
VLQTLVLMQKRSTDPREVVRLAWHTGRDLRAWQYEPAGGGVAGAGGAGDLATALAQAAAGHRNRVSA